MHLLKEAVSFAAAARADDYLRKVVSLGLLYWKKLKITTENLGDSKLLKIENLLLHKRIEGHYCSNLAKLDCKIL